MKVGLALFWLAAAFAADPDETIRQVKSVEQSAGFKPTGNFSHAEPNVNAFYRCYYTGKLELPDSYDKLKMKRGTRDGCRLDETRYDVFFYPIEAVASGHTPVTASLAKESTERIATVVPHEDFHAQIEKLPDPIAEAAATLVGFVTGAAATGEAPLEADLFQRKAELINRYFERLRTIYKAGLPRAGVLQQKRELFENFERECSSIEPAPRSFNRCVSAANNAGLAFDHTYTQYYPLLYAVYENCEKDLACTTRTIMGARNMHRTGEVVRYLEAFATPGRRPTARSLNLLP